MDQASLSSWSEERVPPEEDMRDEKKEVEKMAAKDTFRIRLWRLALLVILLAVAIAVTMTTFEILKQEQVNNFESAFTKFSTTVAHAAVDQQVAVRAAFKGLADAVSASAISQNASWPFFTMPLFETYASNYRSQAQIELFTVFNKVEEKDREEYSKWATANYVSATEEGHLFRYGNLDKLDPSGYEPSIFKLTAEGKKTDDEADFFAAAWTNSPPYSTYGFVNWNLRSIADYRNALQAAEILKNETATSPVRRYSVAIGSIFTQEEHEAMHSELVDSSTEHPHSFLFHPVHEFVRDYESKVVAYVGGAIAWDASLQDLLPDGVAGIHAVISNNCNQSYTYEIIGRDAFFRGNGDLHEDRYNNYETSVSLSLFTNADYKTTPGHCVYSMHIYPSARFEQSYDKNTPEIFASVVSVTFALVAVVFIIYDMLVQKRNHNLVENAAKSNAIVSSMFPGHFRDKLIGQATQDVKGKRTKDPIFGTDAHNGAMEGNAVMADLYLETTILFADIAGFTAWSSVREPHQVFTLLEKIYTSFDKVAKKRRVFKVETVGDCYVAASGLPTPRQDHAIAMARFAGDILGIMSKLTNELEVMLGPDTGDLTLRIGIHSGPVTAGVLRGERSRFQLFGDTINTTARMESYGEPNKIHVSKETADLIIKAGKGLWLHKRDNLIEMKGKGQRQTYWLVPKGDFGEQRSYNESEPSCETSRNEDIHFDKDERQKLDRLIDWNVDMLTKSLKQIIAQRNAKQKARGMIAIPGGDVADGSVFTRNKGQTFLDEVKEIITLPEYDPNATKYQQDAEAIELSDRIKEQLSDYIRCISNMYRANAFHNFEHASHVNMSVLKLLSRIVAPSDLGSVGDQQQNLHDHTYGITSDPLTQFACSFSALVHDVDHTGVPNAQLIKENMTIAALYKNRSIAEQNSLDLSWNLLMDSCFSELRAALFSNQEELKRFRQLIVNIVMATDIVDKDLKQLRNKRWDLAFKHQIQENSQDATNRKATIILEHLIQASDVAHTMQHWHVYRKWNERFFLENYDAFIKGRAEKNPAEYWYKGEIGFFDFYIIPLAKKLKECGVFGKSSDEYLNYAMNNRQEWELRGQQVVAEMVQKANEHGYLKEP